MKIIISPAKKMKISENSSQIITHPIFLDKTNILVNEIKKLSLIELKNLFKCSDNIAFNAYHQFQNFDTIKQTSIALMTYDGIQYTYMGKNIFTKEEYLFLQNHLYIISGLYGLIRPLDEIKLHRLDMGIDYKFLNYKNLYDFWGDTLYRELFKNNDVVINLSSKEYSKAISKYLTKDDKFITIYFYERINEHLIEKAVYCKMARGLMINYIAKNMITNLEELKKFNLLGYTFNQELSSDNNIVFIR